MNIKKINLSGILFWPVYGLGLMVFMNIILTGSALAARNAHIPTDMIVEMTLKKLKNSSQEIKKENEFLDLQNQILQNQIDLLTQQLEEFDREAAEKARDKRLVKESNQYKESVINYSKANRLIGNYKDLEREYNELSGMIQQKKENQKELIDLVEKRVKEMEDVENRIRILKEMGSPGGVEEVVQMVQKVRMEDQKLKELSEQMGLLKSQLKPPKNLGQLQQNNAVLGNNIVSLEAEKKNVDQDVLEGRKDLAEYEQFQAEELSGLLEEVKALSSRYEDLRSILKDYRDFESQSFTEDVLLSSTQSQNLERYLESIEKQNIEFNEQLQGLREILGVEKAR